MRILFINYELHFNTPTATLQGASGKVYGISTWKPIPVELAKEKADAHWVEVTQAEYDACILDVSRAWHVPMKRWVPRFVKGSPAVKTAPAMSPLKTQPEYNNAAAQAEEKPAWVAGRPDTIPQNTRYWTLVKMARDEGADITGLKALPAIREAIYRARDAKQLAAA